MNRRRGLSARSDSVGGSGVLGHPRGLVYLCVSEAWERFSYFGMQSLLVLYMTHQLLMPGHVERVIGFDSLRGAIERVTGPLSTAALASQIFGLYTGLVYLTPFLGGLLADRWLNRTATVAMGALLMAAGHFLMAFEPSFVLAISLLLIGVGCFKGNIASQVGELYSRDDLRRATAYQAFQFSITSAVIVSPLVCGTLGEKVGWHYGFGAAGVGMLIGLVLYLHGRPWLPAERPRLAAGAPGTHSLSPADWRALVLLIALLPLIAGSMVGNQQMFNAFVVWGEANFDLNLLGYEMPVTWLLSFDAVLSAFCILFAVWFWRAFARRWKEPEDLTKIAIGACIMAVAPLLLSLAGARQQMTGARISVGWGLAFELVNEIGFAMLVPVGLSFYSRMAPLPLQGVTVAMFYINSFLCNLAVGRLGGLLEQMPATTFWLMHAAIVAVSAALLVLVAYWGPQRLSSTSD